MFQGCECDAVGIQKKRQKGDEKEVYIFKYRSKGGQKGRHDARRFFVFKPLGHKRLGKASL